MADNTAEVYTATPQPTMATQKYVIKQRRNKFIMLFLLLAVLLTVLAMFFNFFRTGEEPLPTVDVIEKGKILPPNFTNIISGTKGSATLPTSSILRKPLGVAVHPNGDVYVTSSIGNYGRGKVEIFRANGTFVRSFYTIDKGDYLRNPTYIGISGLGEVYVSDRRLRAIYIFDKDGKYLRKFLPNKDPAYKWSPLALAFDDKDQLYVTDVYSDHQVMVFDKDGSLKLKFGSTANAQRKGEFPGKFYFPNGIFIDRDNKIFVADSNNRRVQVFSPQGKLLYIVETGGLPRGIVVDNKDQLYVVDALGHDISVFRKTDREGNALAIFGEQGVDFGQFLYPNSIALDRNTNRIYVTDRENNRVQVWVWPVVAAAVSKQTKQLLPLFLIPLAAGLFAFWLIARRRRYFASATFLDKILANRELSKLSRIGGLVFVHEKAFELVKNLRDGDLMLGDFIRPIQIEQQLVRQTMATHDLNEEAAVLFAAANKGLTRARIMTEDSNSHRVAAKVNIESMDYELFKEYYSD